jgi:hypothetical protein
MNKNLTIILLFSILSASLVCAENITTQDINLLTNTYLQQEAKTRQEIKLYLDQKILLFEKQFYADGQKFIDDNFKILDDRLHNLANLMLFKISMGIIASILVSISTWYLIYRQIQKLKERRRMLKEKVKF